MDPELQRRMQQLRQLAQAGAFGEQARVDTAAYDRAGAAPMGVFLVLVHDFYGDEARRSAPVIEEFTDLFWLQFILVYRAAKRAAPAVADGLIHAIVRDYPGAPDTCIYPQLEALVTAAHAFKAALATSNRVLVWEQTLRLAEAYNEFLNVLLGYYLIAWRTGLGKRASVKTLYNRYAMKVNEFRDLTSGPGVSFSGLLRLAQPQLRNAIAHGNVWLDSATDTIRYTDGKDQRVPYQMPLGELMLLNTVASHLPMTYLASVGAIVVSEAGTVRDVEQLPRQLVDLLRFTAGEA